MDLNFGYAAVGTPCPINQHSTGIRVLIQLYTLFSYEQNMHI